MSNTDDEAERKSLRNLSLASIYGKPVKAGHVGIEVEVEFEEGTEMMLSAPGAWTAKEDGSLRHGMEYVSRAPFKTGPTLKDKIKTLTDALSKYKVVKDSPRTSVHIHVNMLDRTPVEILTAACAFWLVEQPLVNFCGPESRVRNHFCLRLTDAEGLYRRVIYDLNAKGTIFRNINMNESKYSALNLACLSSLGTLEFRSMRGVVDTDLIDFWATGCYDLVDRSIRNFKDPKALMDSFWTEGKGAFLSKIVGPAFMDIITGTPGYQQQIRQSAELVSLLAYCVDDSWEKWLERRCSPHKEPSKDEKLANVFAVAAGQLNISPSQPQVYYYDDLG